MKTKICIVAASMLLALAGTVSCSRAPSDAAITADVQVQMHQNAALSAAPITVQSSRGVVVLSGSVPSAEQRLAAENLARQATGVRAVINNLQVVTAAAAPLPQPAPDESQSPLRRPSARRAPAARIAPPPAPAALPAPSPVAPAPVQAAASQPVKAVPARITIPQGTRLSVRLIDPVDTEKNKEGDTFRASLDAPVVVQNRTAIPRNADVTARLVSSKSAGRFSGSSSVVLVLTRVVVGGKAYSVQTGEFSQKGKSRGGRTAAVIGGTAAVGAVIGAIAGGGKGAAVGTAAGAGAGTAVQAMTKGEQIRLPAETQLQFQLSAPLTVAAISEAAERESLDLPNDVSTSGEPVAESPESESAPN